MEITANQRIWLEACDEYKKFSDTNHYFSYEEKKKVEHALKANVDKAWEALDISEIVTSTEAILKWGNNK